MAKQQVEVEELTSFLEERADYLEENELLACTVQDGDFYKSIYTALISRGTKLIVGPRGCGKTHLMRYAWTKCKGDESLPLAIYVSFNKYFRLEPLLKSKPNAIALFNTWVLAKILIAAHEVACDIEDDQELDLSSILFAKKQDLESIVERLEQSLSPTSDLEFLVEKISVSGVTSALHSLTDWLERKRIVILLDDAAITLTPEYLYEFFDIVRTLKTSRISPKASVYPGTTEYGPKFHVAHEAESVDAWLSIEAENYTLVLGAIAQKRFNEYDKVPDDISQLLKYAAFGIPRAYLMMLREYHSDNSRSSQQKFNKLIEKYTSVRLSEYRSLVSKLPRLESIIDTGEAALNKIVELIKDANSPAKKTIQKQIIVGIEEEENPLFNRMISLLVEVGLLLKLPNVSHGEDRSYERYIPHLALLIRSRVFSQGLHGFSPQHVIDFIGRKNVKHPVRRSSKTLLGEELLQKLQLTLPPCRKCNAIRLTDTQRFCHQCGSLLVDESTFNKCMALELSNLPRLTSWQSKVITGLDGAKTVGDILSMQDPGTELRKLRRVGRKTADKIISNVLLYVDEFLS